jgi:hypothetical protein
MISIKGLNNWGPKISTDGLIFLVDAANDKSYNGSTWVDMKSRMVGTFYNGPTFSTDGIGSIKFNGTNSYIGFVPTSSYVLNNMTIQMWVNPLSNNGNYKAFAGSVGSNGVDYQTGFCIDMKDVFTYNFTVCNMEGGFKGGGGGYNYMSSGQQAMNLPFGYWYNICFTISPTVISFYLNGVLGNTQSRINNYSTTIGLNNLVIGNRPISLSNDSSDSKISICMLYNRALSSVEALQNYDAHKGRFGY